MKILLLNIDSKLPNIALKKIEMYHELRGDDITWDEAQFYYVDKVYASCIFTKNKERVDKLVASRPCVVAGGTGYDYGIQLPPEIEAQKPKINIGYTVRGCPRKCPFCLAWRAEGKPRVVGDIYDLWDGASDEIVLYDNSPYAILEHFEKICYQLIAEKLSVDWNQGMDIRFLTPHICELLNKLKLSHGVRFAFDHISMEGVLREKVAMLRQYYKRKYVFFYVLVGYDSTFEEDMARLNILKELGCRAYVMRHENTPKEKRYIRMAEWVNQFWTFAKYDFDTFCVEYEKYKANYVEA